MFAPTCTVDAAVTLLNVAVARPEVEPLTSPPSATRFRPTLDEPTNFHVPSVPVSET